MVRVVGGREEESLFAVVNRSKATDPVAMLFVLLSGLFLSNKQGCLLKHSVNFVADVAIRVVGFELEIVDNENLNIIAGYIDVQILLCLQLYELGGNNNTNLLPFIQ